MKSFSFSLLASMLFVLNIPNVNAQCTDCWHWGGDPITNPSLEYIGTITKQNFVIRTWDFERVVVDTFGNIGIGTYLPTKLLDVNGTVNITDTSSSPSWTSREYMIGGVRALKLVPSVSNLFAGEGSGNANPSGTGNTYIGYKAGYSDTTGYENTFIGAHAGFSNADNYRNTFIGFYSGQASSGNRNTFTGHASGAFNTGSDNTFIGFNTGTFNSGNFNTYIGNNSGSDTSSGGSNTFIGYRTGENNTSGSENTLLGLDAGRNNISGSRNTFVGNRAGEASTGSNNTYIGYNARGTDTLTNAAAIGYNALVTRNNSMVLGGTGSDKVNVGIGLTDPGYRFHVVNDNDTVTFFNKPSTIAGRFVAKNANVKNQYGVIGESSNSADFNTGILGNAVHGDTANYGVQGLAKDSFATGANYGVSGVASGSNKLNVGLAGLAETVPGKVSIANIGVDGEAKGHNINNTGIVGKASDGMAVNYGLRGEVVDSTPVPTDTAHYTAVRGLAMGSNTENIGISGYSETVAGQDSVVNIGVEGEAKGIENNHNVGVWGKALHGFSNTGVRGIASSSDAVAFKSLQENLNIGVKGEASGRRHSNWGMFASADYEDTLSHLDPLYAIKNIGIQANAGGSRYENRAGSFITMDTSGISYSVAARSTFGAAVPGVNWGGAPRNYAGFYLGDVFVSGNIINQCAHPEFTRIVNDSTRNVDGNNALNIVANLQPKEYFTNQPGRVGGLTNGWHMSFDTLNVDTVFPGVVFKIYKTEDDTAGIGSKKPVKALSYSEFTPLLTAAVKRLNEKMDSAGTGLWQLSGGNMTLQDTAWNVGIGTSALAAKLHVENDTQQIGAFVSTTRAISAPNAANIGAYGNSTGATNGVNVGVRGVASNTTSVISLSNLQNAHIGISGEAKGSVLNFGGQFKAEGTSIGSNYGVYARTIGAKYNFAGGFVATGTAGVNIAVWGRTFNSDTNSYINPAGYFQGYSVSTSPTLWPSDLTLKDSIQNILNPLATLSLLEPKSFVFKTDSFEYMNLPAGTRYGFISQALDTLNEFENLVEAVVQPEILDTDGTVLLDSFTFLGLNYTEILPVVVGAVKQLDSIAVKSCESATLPHRIPKWNGTAKTLCNTNIIAENGRVGIDSLHETAKFTVFTATDSFGIQAQGAEAGARFRGAKGGVFGLANGGADTSSYDEFHAGVIGISENAPVHRR